MAHHSRLKNLTGVKHLKSFSKSLRGIEKDFEKLGGLDYDIEVSKLDSTTSFLRRLFIDGGLNDVVETMVINTEFHDCPTKIVVPISRRRITMPYTILVELPFPIHGRAEYRRGNLGNKWRYEPKNKARLAGLKKLVPKVKMTHNHGSLVYLIKYGHLFEPLENDKTRWQISSGYEGSAFSGGRRPRVLNFMKAIPNVKELLIKWNDE